jgi:hypothetical protein
MNLTMVAAAPWDCEFIAHLAAERWALRSARGERPMVVGRKSGTALWQRTGCGREFAAAQERRVRSRHQRLIFYSVTLGLGESTLSTKRTRFSAHATSVPDR